jgi:hypothetical protein
MNPENRTGALLVLTLCVAGSSPDRGLFAPTSRSVLAADADAAAARPPRQ